MPRISLVNLAHQHLKAKLRPGDIAIDATVGNGHDTAFLLAQVQPCGHVYGFDIQPAALAATRAKLGVQPCLTLIQASHAELAERIPKRHHGHIRACLFNLGYLPGGDKRIITQSESTLIALTAACNIVSVGGIVTVVAYPGHPGGDLETTQVQHWCAQLDAEQFKLSVIDSQQQNLATPRLFVIEKLGRN